MPRFDQKICRDWIQPRMILLSHLMDDQEASMMVKILGGNHRSSLPHCSRIGPLENVYRTFLSFGARQRFRDVCCWLSLQPIHWKRMLGNWMNEGYSSENKLYQAPGTVGPGREKNGRRWWLNQKPVAAGRMTSLTSETSNETSGTRDVSLFSLWLTVLVRFTQGMDF